MRECLVDRTRLNSPPGVIVPDLDGFLFDLRLAARALRRDRGCAVTTSVTLTIALPSTWRCSRSATRCCSAAFRWLNAAIGSRARPGEIRGIVPTCGVIALMPAGVGLVAIVAHSVSQRTKEIGVRMAIGAARAEIAQLFGGVASFAQASNFQPAPLVLSRTNRRMLRNCAPAIVTRHRTMAM